MQRKIMLWFVTVFNLKDRLSVDQDQVHEVEDMPVSNYDHFIIFPHNPMNLGFWLVGI